MPRRRKNPSFAPSEIVRGVSKRDVCLAVWLAACCAKEVLRTSAGSDRESKSMVAAARAWVQGDLSSDAVVLFNKNGSSAACKAAYYAALAAAAADQDPQTARAAAIASVRYAEAATTRPDKLCREVEEALQSYSGVRKNPLLF